MQSRTMSLVWAMAVGRAVAVVTQILTFPSFGLHMTLVLSFRPCALHGCLYFAGMLR